MALPGVLVTLVVTLVAVPVAALRGLGLPLNGLLLLVGVLLACVAFVALALWTAAWTRTAESAQMTSAPVILLATVGFFTPFLPAASHRWLDLLPGSAVRDLVQVAWLGRGAGAGAEGVVDLASSWAATGPALATLLGWTVVAVLLAVRSMRWEPRA